MSGLARGRDSDPGVRQNLSQRSTETGRERNLDLLRGLGAVAVVLLHAPPLYHSSQPVLRGLGWGLRELCQVAVPLFFLISGYLAGRRTSDLPGGRRTLSRIAWLYIPWFAFYLAIDLAQAGRNLDFLVVLRRFLGVGVEGASTSGYHLWFLPAMFWGFLILRMSCKWFGSSVPALVLGLLLYSVVGWFSFPSEPLPWKFTAHEGVNLSLLFLAIGHVYGRHLGQGKPPVRLGYMYLAATALWLLVEGFLLGWLGNRPFVVPSFQTGRILLPVVLLLVATSSAAWAFRGAAGAILDSLAACSTGIYVLHLAILEVIPFDVLVPNGFLRDNLVRWFVALAISMGLTTLALRWGPKRIRHLFA